MSKFKPPSSLSDLAKEKEKEKAADRFISGASRVSAGAVNQSTAKKGIYLRLPDSIHDGLARIEALTDIKKNIFIQLVLQEAIKTKLRELERDKE